MISRNFRESVFILRKGWMFKWIDGFYRVEGYLFFILFFLLNVGNVYLVFLIL